MTLLCGGWPGCEPTATLDGIEVIRIGTRYTFPFLARKYFNQHLAGRSFDLLVEDVNKVPLYTPRWRGPPVVALVPHLFGSTAFKEFPAPMASAVWLAELPLGRSYRGVPFQAISMSTAADLADREFLEGGRSKEMRHQRDHRRAAPSRRVERDLVHVLDEQIE